MQTITSKSLRLKLREVLDAVSNGEEYILTFQKKPVGKIVPLTKTEKSSKNLLGFLNSSEFKNREIPKHLKQFEDFKEFHKKNYSKHDK
jgi:antitoxin (DNA-binding transcriptional repressor) of toxin-antitoxin stability system